MMILFRPTGRKELELVSDAGWRASPPRLPDQSIICPVLTFEHAERISPDGSAVRPAADDIGFAARFKIDETTPRRHPPQSAGGAAHSERRFPAEELDTLDAGIVGLIEVAAARREGAQIDADAPATLI